MEEGEIESRWETSGVGGPSIVLRLDRSLVPTV